MISTLKYERAINYKNLRAWAERIDIFEKKRKGLNDLLFQILCPKFIVVWAVLNIVLIQLSTECFFHTVGAEVGMIIRPTHLFMKGVLFVSFWHILPLVIKLQKCLFFFIFFFLWDSVVSQKKIPDAGENHGRILIPVGIFLPASSTCTVCHILVLISFYK